MPSKKTLFLIPAPGLKVVAYHRLGRNPNAEDAHLKQEGERVPDMPEYRRALKFGDVTQDPSRLKKSTKSKKSARKG